MGALKNVTSREVESEEGYPLLKYRCSLWEPTYRVSWCSKQGRDSISSHGFALLGYCPFYGPAPLRV